MNFNKTYVKQVNNLKMVIDTRPRVYIRWENTEAGRDKIQCYERENNTYTRYVNVFNPTMTVIRGDKFFDILEDLYNTSYANMEIVS